jgi:DNA-binding response OmpR family regulator
MMLADPEAQVGGRVLVVEDDADIADVLRRSLRNEGYEVRTSADGVEALDVAVGFVPDLVVLDLGLPGLDGVEVCRRLRMEGDVPILILTARTETEDRVTGLDSGADDYLVKPFDFKELLARLRALLRRPAEVRPAVVRVADLTVDTGSHAVERGGRTVPLTAKEYALLEFLVRNEGRVVGREQIAEHVWDDAFDPLTNIIDVYVKRLRAKLDQGQSPRLIHTRRGEGYILTAEPGASDD